MKKQFLILLITGIVAMAASCRKDPSNNTGTTTTQYGKTKLEFFNNVGSSKLNMNTQWYKNENGDSFMVSKFNYYISNVKLTGVSGTGNYAEPNSYHLVQESDASSQSFDMSNVPYGKYSSITFTIGIDSLMNVSGAQAGALDPLNGMFWDWNTGYIMMKFEGTSPQAKTTNGVLQLHLGGFSGANSVVKTVTLSFDEPIQVGGNTPHVHLTADVLALFKSPNKIDFSNTATIMTPGAAAKKIADNYANMFTITYAGL